MLVNRELSGQKVVNETDARAISGFNALNVLLVPLPSPFERLKKSVALHRQSFFELIIYYCLNINFRIPRINIKMFVSTS